MAIGGSGIGVGRGVVARWSSWRGRLRCVRGGHARRAAEIWNDGIWFARCQDCGRDVVRFQRGTPWRLVPSGHRIVWRGRDATPTHRRSMASEAMAMPAAAIPTAASVPTSLAASALASRATGGDAADPALA